MSERHSFPTYRGNTTENGDPFTTNERTLDYGQESTHEYPTKIPEDMYSEMKVDWADAGEMSETGRDVTTSMRKTSMTVNVSFGTWQELEKFLDALERFDETIYNTAKWDGKHATSATIEVPDTQVESVDEIASSHGGKFMKTAAEEDSEIKDGSQVVWTVGDRPGKVTVMTGTVCTVEFSDGKNPQIRQVWLSELKPASKKEATRKTALSVGERVTFSGSAEPSEMGTVTGLSSGRVEVKWDNGDEGWHDVHDLMPVKQNSRKDVKAALRSLATQARSETLPARLASKLDSIFLKSYLPKMSWQQVKDALFRERRGDMNDLTARLRAQGSTLDHGGLPAVLADDSLVETLRDQFWNGFVIQVQAELENQRNPIDVPERVLRQTVDYLERQERQNSLSTEDQAELGKLLDEEDKRGGPADDTKNHVVTSANENIEAEADDAAGALLAEINKDPKLQQTFKWLVPYLEGKTPARELAHHVDEARDILSQNQELQDAHGFEEALNTLSDIVGPATTDDEQISSIEDSLYARKKVGDLRYESIEQPVNMSESPWEEEAEEDSDNLFDKSDEGDLNQRVKQVFSDNHAYTSPDEYEGAGAKTHDDLEDDFFGDENPEKRPDVRDPKDLTEDMDVALGLKVRPGQTETMHIGSVKEAAGVEIPLDLFTDQDSYSTTEYHLGSMVAENLTDARPRILANRSELINQAADAFRKVMSSLKAGYTAESVSLQEIRGEKVEENTGMMLKGKLSFSVTLASHIYRRRATVDLVFPVLGGEPQPTLLYCVTSTGHQIPFTKEALDSHMGIRRNQAFSGKTPPRLDQAFIIE